jgi:hypothetical protein
MLGFKQNIFDKGKATHFHLIFKPFTAFFSSYILKRFYGWIPGLARKRECLWRFLYAKII